MTGRPLVHGLTCTCHPRQVRRQVIRSAWHEDMDTGGYTGTGARWHVPDNATEAELAQAREDLHKRMDVYDRTPLGNTGILHVDKSARTAHDLWGDS